MVECVILCKKNRTCPAFCHFFNNFKSQGLLIYRYALDEKSAHGNQFICHGRHFQRRCASEFQETNIMNQICP